MTAACLFVYVCMQSLQPWSERERYRERRGKAREREREGAVGITDTIEGS